MLAGQLPSNAPESGPSGAGAVLCAPCFRGHGHGRMCADSRQPICRYQCLRGGVLLGSLMQTSMSGVCQKAAGSARVIGCCRQPSIQADSVCCFGLVGGCCLWLGSSSSGPTRFLASGLIECCTARVALCNPVVSNRSGLSGISSFKLMGIRADG